MISPFLVSLLLAQAYTGKHFLVELENNANPNEQVTSCTSKDEEQCMIYFDQVGNDYRGVWQPKGKGGIFYSIGNQSINIVFFFAIFKSWE